MGSLKAAIVFSAAAVFLPAFAYAETPADTGNSSVATEQCIRANADKVERAIPDLKQAASFLVDYVCAVQVAAENARRTARTSEQWQDQIKAACADAKKDKPAKDDEDTYDFCNNPTSKIGFVTMAQYANASDDDDYTFTGTRSAKDIALAAGLLLDLRLAHSSPHR